VKLHRACGGVNWLGGDNPGAGSGEEGEEKGARLRREGRGYGGLASAGLLEAGATGDGIGAGRVPDRCADGRQQEAEKRERRRAPAYAAKGAATAGWPRLAC
jgi:hypothetical protein